MFAMKCDEVRALLELLRCVDSLLGSPSLSSSHQEVLSTLLQQDKTAMKRVGQATVKVLKLTAPWASTLDAQKLRGKVLGGDVFRAFNQPEREEIWNRLQSLKGLVPSLYAFFEDIKLLEAWANCLKWVMHLGARDTVPSALRKTYTGANQATGWALIQETETTFNPVPADLAYQMDLGCRQLWAFAMRYHREIPKKPSDKNLLARPTPMVDTRKLREMADLVNRLGFQSSEITALKQHPNSTGSAAVTGNNRPILVKAGPGETRKERCGMPHIQSYQDDRKFVFIPHLHDNRNEQSEGITSFSRLRSVYSDFYGTPGNAPGIQDHPSLEQRHDLGGVTSPAPHMSSSEYSPRQGQTREPEHMVHSSGAYEPKKVSDLLWPANLILSEIEYPLSRRSQRISSEMFRLKSLSSALTRASLRMSCIPMFPRSRHDGLGPPSDC